MLGLERKARKAYDVWVTTRTSRLNHQCRCYTILATSAHEARGLIACTLSDDYVIDSVEEKGESM